MKNLRLALLASLLAAAAPAWAEDAVGKWTGMLRPMGGELPLVATISKETGGKLAGYLESPSQTEDRIAAEAFESDGKILKFTSKRVGGEYAGTWDDAKKAWVGTWKQGGMELELELKRAPVAAR